LEHAENYKQLINNMSRVLKPGGILLVSTPFMWAEHGLPYDFRRLTETSLRKQTSAFGLKVIHFEKSLSGIEAIRTIVKSEMTIFKRRHINHKKPLKRLLKVLDIPMNLLWKFVQWYWSLFYRFERIYIRNILIAEKT
jgi:2-polyprenyl-3-methyl-5-hydroxy-6-metoxy-1,4-benzoquinol methylase